MKTLHGLLLLGTAVVLPLSACKKTDDAPKAAAGGQLLERSVTDDMLPYDTVRSQASLEAPDDGLDMDRSDRPRAAASEEGLDEPVVSDPVEPEDLPPPPSD
ncbi:hypothetical protein [Novosphingobium sp. Leaf2]|uniref:hypothetical protein n=1 Tax=Novosphingobium sp. Leaf2 TaxID=1735670 RepID=UPI0006FBD455|nr:hypothetical protein [Novosphingobium sp. Leaf2]KQM19539.1 hypothetical protein ASE49_04760 [Novosphingobium sp. Leaf2]